MGFCILRLVCRLLDIIIPQLVSVVFAQKLLSICFFACPLARSALDWIQALLFRASPSAGPLAVRHLLLGFLPDEMRTVPRLFVYLLLVCKYLIWIQCNDCRFRSVHPSAVNLISGIRARVKFYLPLFFKRFHSSRRCHYFVRQWGAHGTIYSIAHAELVFSPCF